MPTKRPPDYPTDWPTVPLEDAAKTLEYELKPRDVKGAVPRDPGNCAAARGARRVLNGDVLAVRIGASVAYVLYADRCVRYFVSNETKRMVRAYDQIEYYPSGVKVRLNPPPVSKRLGAQPKGRSSGARTQRTPSVKKPWLRHVGRGDATL